jgi:predicted TPR repeat methyltransferase
MPPKKKTPAKRRTAATTAKKKQPAKKAVKKTVKKAAKNKKKPARPARKSAAAEIRTLLARAEKAREREDHEASRKALERVLELSPKNDQAIWWMGDYWHTVDKAKPALKYYRAYLKIHPGDPEAVHMIASLGGRPAPKRASDDYVAMHFDSYAEDFDKSLVGELKYQAPKLLVRAIAKVRGKKAEPGDVLDLGCGTGLVGVEIKPMARKLTGVDLARKMLREARKRGIYDRLVAEEVTRFARGQRGKFDIIVSADVLIYFGDITALFNAAAKALRPGGVFGISVESHTGGTYKLTSSGRYSHNPAWLRQVAEKAGLVQRHGAKGRLRFEVGKPVPGYFAVYQRPL